MRKTGRYESTSVGGETIQAFVPYDLPPREPPVVLDGKLLQAVRRAEAALSRLDLASSMVPSLDWFIYSFVRKEAVISSQIEGTQATLDDLLNFEAKAKGSAPEDVDVEEVCNYLDALAFARAEQKRPRGLSLSVRLLNETHKRLMAGVRGADKIPGEIRKSQNWIGGTRPGNAVFVPPPPQSVGGLLGSLENYIHKDHDLPPLCRAGLAHVQFETIHPYLDGNGRIGRLFITLLLLHWELLREPVLYLSLFFKRHRSEYYRRLDAVRTDGDYEGWLEYFLEGVEVIADEAVTSTRNLFAMISADRAKVLSAQSVSVTGSKLFEVLPEHPVVTIGKVVELLGTTKPTAAKAVGTLVSAGILVETTGKARDRTFRYEGYLALLREGTELSRQSPLKAEVASQPTGQ